MGIFSPRQSWASNTHQQGEDQWHPNWEQVNDASLLYSHKTAYTTPSSRYSSSSVQHLETMEPEQTQGRRRARDPSIFESIYSRRPCPRRALCTQQDGSSSGKLSFAECVTAPQRILKRHTSWISLNGLTAPSLPQSFICRLISSSSTGITNQNSVRHPIFK